MANLLDQVAIGGKPLWLDYTAYAGKLLAGGRIPWLDVAGFIGWQRKAQGLLKSDVIAVPLAPLIAEWLDAHAALVKAMGEKKRALFPLKTLLAETALRAHLLELFKGLRSSFGQTALALVLPSPAYWIVNAYTQSGGDAGTVEIGDDEIDGASVFVADFLRAFGESGIDTVLLKEAVGHPSTAAPIELYRPMINVAAHYRWDFGIHLAGNAGEWTTPAGLGFVIAATGIAGLATGIETPAAFWSGAPPPASPPNGFRFAEVPADANPEKVLDLLGALRA